MNHEDHEDHKEEILRVLRDLRGSRITCCLEGDAVMFRRVLIAMLFLLVVSFSLEAQGGRGRGGGAGGQGAAAQKVTAIRAGRLIDPETGAVATNQIILVQGETIADVGPSVAIPPNAEQIDLSRLTVLPGFVDTHTHEAITYKEVPENNIYYYTYVADPTPLRSIQAASNALQM